MATEKRLIDANALLREVMEGHPYEGLSMAAQVCTMELLTYAPTVDAVEVVRCKDCRHYVLDEFDGCYICLHICKYVKPNFGCVDGERKDNERKAD